MDLPVLTMSDEMREQLNKKYNAVVTKLSTLKKVQKAEVKTSGEFKYSPDSNRVACSIHKETNLATLIAIYAFLGHKKASYDTAASELGLSTVGYPAFVWLGYKVKDWMDDILIRVSVISYKEELERLTKIKEELQQYFLPEDKLRRLFDTLKDIDDIEEDVKA